MNKSRSYLSRHWAALFALVTKTLAVAFAMLVSQAAQAQTYAYKNDVFAYDTPSGTASSVTWHTSGASPGCTSYPNGDDDWADVALPGGFAFTFAGTAYTSVRVYSNGILAYGADVSGFHRAFTSQALPITAAVGSAPTGCPNAVPQNLMLPYWLDIVAGTANSTTGASVQYELLGTAPNRRFVISWVNVKLYGLTTRYNFQVQLLESTAGLNGNFRYQYTTGSSTGSGATVGVQLTTTDSTQYAYNQNFIDTTVGTAILWYPANQLVTKSAEYRFDESVWLGVAGEIKDTSGNGQNASRVGLATSVAPGFFPGGKLCRGGSFTGNTLNTTIDAVATPLVPGNQGSVDFWFTSNVIWNSAAAMLLDATSVANRPFFLMKSAAGALTFVVTDSAGTSVTATAPAQTFALNEWHHVGIAWNVRAGTNQTALQIFLDGALQNGVPTRGTTNGFMPGLSSIYVGDNRTLGVTPVGGTPNGANGSIDEVYVYAVEISAPQELADKKLTRATCTALDHFHIKHDGGVSSCTAPASITIEAHDATHALFSLAGTSMNLTTSPARGTWSNVANGAINPLTAIGSGTGTASYTFAGESTVTFGLSDNLTEALNINVASGAITEHTGTASVCVFSDYTNTNSGTTTCDDSRSFVCTVPFGFNCVESGTNPLNGHLYTKLAGTGFAFDVVALKDANSDGIADAVETLYASDADKKVTVELVDGSGATACTSRLAISPAVSQTLTFTKAAQPSDLGRKSTLNMTVTKAYSDLRCRVTDANQSPNIVSCSTDDFAVRPSQFTISSSNAGNAGTSGTPTIKTEAPFSLTATAVAGYGSTPLINTALLIGSPIVGSLTGSFPAAATATGIATGAAFAYTEVGTLGLSANAVYDSTYTSVDAPSDCTTDFSNVSVGGKYGCSFGNAAVPLSSGFGRFIPDHFDTTVVVAAGVPMACPSGLTCPTLYNGSVYSGQPFVVSTTAKNLSGATTQNYSSAGYSKAVTLSPFTSKGSATAVAGTLSGNRIAASSFALGVSTSPAFSYGFTASAPPNGPTDIYLRATEDAGGDAVSSLRVTNPTTTSVEGGVKVLQGRFWIPNVYGSELLALPIQTAVQFYNGSYWTTSTMDSVSSFNSNLTSVTGGNVVATIVNGLSGGVSMVSPGTAAVAAGLRIITLAAPGANQSGNVNISLNAPTYLPSTIGRATFGIIRSPLIYRRENY